MIKSIISFIATCETDKQPAGQDINAIAVSQLSYSRHFPKSLPQDEVMGVLDEKSYWEPIATAPVDKSIDIMYCNDTFDLPVTGVLEDAVLSHDQVFWISWESRRVPAKFAVGWRPREIQYKLDKA